jgi:hypothetical protein
MASVSFPARPVKASRRVYPPAVAEVELIRPVAYPCTLLPHGQPGVVRINATVYLLVPVAGWEGDDLVVEGYRFVKSAEQTHDVQVTRWGLECSCADHVFRRRVNNECKHASTVRQLRERGDLV